VLAAENLPVSTAKRVKAEVKAEPSAWKGPKPGKFKYWTQPSSGVTFLRGSANEAYHVDETSKEPPFGAWAGLVQSDEEINEDAEEPDSDSEVLAIN
jgi:hypothetical protein